MKKNGLLFLTTIIFLGSVLLLWSNDQQQELRSGTPSPGVVSATPSPQGAQTEAFKAQTKLVLVDTIVTDKKNNYMRDLAEKDFRVWEDNKEQRVKSFSYETEDGSPDSTKRYLVLFFDDSHMDYGDQAIAKRAAEKFIDANIDRTASSPHWTLLVPCSLRRTSPPMVNA
jgi:hypothetical protein